MLRGKIKSDKISLTMHNETFKSIKHHICLQWAEEVSIEKQRVLFC